MLDGRPARSPLPDAAERLASRVAAAALASRCDEALALEAALTREDAARAKGGEPPSGLADNAAEVVASCDGSDAFPRNAQALLERDDLDPAHHRRLEQTLASDPLALADARISEERQWKAGSIFNRVVEPLSQLLISGIANPIEAARTTLVTMLTAHKFPEASVRERRALRAWDDWLARHPDDPRGAEIAARAATYRARLANERYDRALKGAEAAFESRELARARILAGRALEYRPDSAPAARIVELADSELAAHDARTRASLAICEAAPAALDERSIAAYAALARAALIAPPDRVAARARAWRTGGAPPEVAGELAFLESFALLAPAREDEFFAALLRVPERAVPGDPIARQATAIVADPRQNPYAAYSAAASADSRARLGWIAFGRHAGGRTERDLPAPIEYLLDVPAFAISLVTLPVRLIQYPSQGAKFGVGVLQTGERYTERRPHGQHAEEIHRELEALYAERGQPGAALRHAKELPAPDAAKIARYRDQVAEQMLASAERERRVDMKLALLASVAREYAGTPAGERAKDAFIAARRAVTPQRIRLTHDFLVEHPELWAPGALDLHPELLDGARRNGEIADSGVTLVGRNAIEISLEDRDPIALELPSDDFARFVARLEQVEYASLARDERERPVADPARDAFLASARLGVAAASDSRPSARSEAVFESTQEKHGTVYARESILPVDLVLRGDLETLGLAAFPRIRLPEAPADSMLYD